MKDRSNTLIVNLIGGPCCGKSTIASELFARLKKMNITCELVPEYIKERIYEENKTSLSHQLYLFANECYAIDNKIGKVDVIIRDVSLLTHICYDRDNDKELHDFIAYIYHKYDNLDFFLNRGSLSFENTGRIHSLEESIAIDNKIKAIYDTYDSKYIEIDARDATEKIVPYVLKKLGN